MSDRRHSLPVLPAERGATPDLQGLSDAVHAEVRTARHDRMLYATDASIYQVEPLGVVIPATVDDAAGAVGWCGQRRIPMLPRGGGTSLAGQGVNRAVIIDLAPRCGALLGVDAAARTARVEPGLTVDDLNDRLRPSGLFFAPDPATARHANIGGCIGNNAAGSHSILYGRTSESVLGIDACLWDGTRVTLDDGAPARDPTARRLAEGVADIARRHDRLIRDRFPKTLRRSAGYQLDVMLQQLDRAGGDPGGLNLSQLLCGSEGTLAFTLGATLRLHQIPRAKGLAVLAFDSVEAAIDAVVPILGLRPSAVELLDDLIIDLARQNAEYATYVDLLPRSETATTVKAVLYVEFFSEQGVDEIRERFAALRALLPGSAMEAHTEPVAMANAWKLRKAGEPLLHAIPGGRKPLGFVEDNAVPPERLGEFVRRFKQLVQDEGTMASFYAHASVGVLHVRPLLNLADPQDEGRMHRIALGAAHLAKELGGVMSGEHGDGRARGPLLEDYFGPELMGAFREVKALFDPHGLLNPGNIVSPGPLESISLNTRVRPHDRVLHGTEVETAFLFADQGGLMHAAEMCNGAGVCRKKQGGTMCPSYMATLDERHATRGRGNALRLAMTGQTSPGGEDRAEWGDPGTLETLNLCLSCKACKTECPSNVDIARLKAEYLHQTYRDAGRIPLQSRVFGSIHRLNRLAGRTPRLVNAVNRFGPTRGVLNRVLGLDPRRSLPVFGRPVRRRSVPKAGAPTVVMLVDSFTTHNEASIAEATVRVLSAFGYAVEVVPVSDLGRAAISTGLLDHAIRDAERTLDQLRSFVEDDRVIAFVVPEPSCLSSITDDWLDLRIDRPIELRRRLAERSMLPEQFISAAWEKHPHRPEFALPPGTLVVHGHCHQKALWGIGSSTRALELVAPGRVRALDSGCCGLAGSFGYTADRFDLSMKIGELSVFPAVRAASEQDWLVMPGTSCRHQTLDATGRHAMHPIEAIGRLMVTPL
jgi:FAD/FMN-containing dehydrogenase/Fe-S oxidoreductase